MAGSRLTDNTKQQPQKQAEEVPQLPTVVLMLDAEGDIAFDGNVALLDMISIVHLGLHKLSAIHFQMVMQAKEKAAQRRPQILVPNQPMR